MTNSCRKRLLGLRGGNVSVASQETIESLLFPVEVTVLLDFGLDLDL